MQKTRLIIGNKNTSSWSLRGWLAARLVGLDFEEILVPLGRPETKTKIKTYSPSGRVPVLHHNDMVIWDSLSIGEYLAEQFPEAGLWPENPIDRAQARSICAEMHAGFAPLRSACPMNINGQNKSYEKSPEVEENCARIEAIWNDALSKSKGPFLFGKFGLADIFFAPVVSRFRTYSIPLHPHVQAYADRVWNHALMQEWIKDS